MSNFKAALFDADGVLIRQPEYFSNSYARQHGLDPTQLETFFKEDFLSASLGKADLKQLLIKRYDLWQWDGDPQDLLDQWFAAENHPDNELLALIASLRRSGLKAYVATIQEKYRSAYLREVMFPDQFDALFTSSDLGYHKRDLGFFEEILKVVTKDMPGIKPAEIVYFDDNQEGLITAEKLGITTYLYESVDQVRTVLS